MTDLDVPGLLAQTRSYAGGRSAPSHDLEAALGRIAARNADLNALVAVDEGGARAAAARADARWRAGAPLSPIDGATVVVKANLAVAGMPWTAAIAGYADRRAAADAFVVARLRAAGAVVLGVANMDEAALGGATRSRLYGPAFNPLAEDRTPGGSSGGSAAAVAAGFAAAALGTDTMGSVRLPAAYTGTCGFKPSFGRLSRSGLILLSRSFDHVGLHARAPEDLSALFDAVDAFDPDDPDAARHPPAPTTAGLRIAALTTAGTPVSEGIARRFADAIARLTALGADVRSATLDGWDFGRARRLGLLVIEAEGAAALAELRQQPDALSPELRAMLDYGAQASAARLAAAQAALGDSRRLARRMFAQFDALICPTAAETAFPARAAAPTSQADLTAFANFAGLPAVSIPMGTAEDGLPAGLQILAPAGHDRACLALAAAFAASAPVR